LLVYVQRAKNFNVFAAWASAALSVVAIIFHIAAISSLSNSRAYSVDRWKEELWVFVLDTTGKVEARPGGGWVVSVLALLIDIVACSVLSSFAFCCSAVRARVRRSPVAVAIVAG
jgi:hypothetical protein